METSLLGVFSALDFFIWFVFWEMVLVPMYFLIGIWGGPRRKYAAIKFFVYTNVASLLMFIGFIGLVFGLGDSITSLDMPAIAQALNSGQLARPRWHRRGHAESPRVLRDVHRLRREGPDSPVPHVAAGRSRRSTDAGVGHAGGRHAEDGYLRAAPVQLHHASRRGEGLRVHHRPLGGRERHLRCAPRVGQPT